METQTQTHLKETLKNLPHTPGVYIYRDTSGVILYVGKAVDLYKRVHHYFVPQVIGPKTAQLVSQIHSIETMTTDSEFDALLLEARLIKKHQPKYNIIAKDDKSPIYIRVTTSEDLPQILLVRKGKKDEKIGTSRDHVFGPFQSSKTARNILRTIRTIVPYCSQKQRNGKACFYTHLGLCSPCPSVVAKFSDTETKTKLTKEYRTNIRRIIAILSGKSKIVREELTHEMQRYAQQNQFEQATKFRNNVTHLESLLKRRFDPTQYLTDNQLLEKTYETELSDLHNALSHWYPKLKELKRIECFDISNTFGTYPVGSMVVLTDGIIDTSQYRRFRIKLGETPNDAGMMQEMIKRRLKHTTWPRADLIVIDGGKPQLRAVAPLISEAGIPCIGLAKRFEDIVIPTADGFETLQLNLTRPAIHILQRIRDEAHRFAITYHKLLRGKTYKALTSKS